MARRLQELLHPAQDGLLEPVRDGEVEVGGEVADLDLATRDLGCRDIVELAAAGGYVRYDVVEIG